MAAQCIPHSVTVVPVIYCLLLLLFVCVSINPTFICGHETAPLSVQNTTFNCLFPEIASLPGQPGRVHFSFLCAGMWSNPTMTEQLTILINI